MKINKLFTVGLLSLFVLASCDDAKEPVYTPASPVANPDVYFNLGENNDTIQLKDGQSSYNIPIYRKSSEGEITYQLQVTNVSPLYTSYPTQVTFADGQTSTNLTVTFDFANVEAGKYYDITYTIPGTENTDYYLGTVSQTCYFAPWRPVVGPKGETTAKWRDNLIFGLFNLPEDYSEWDVTIEESPNEDGIFRIPNPYKNCEYLLEYIDPSDELYVYLNAQNPEQVFFCDKDGNPQTWTNTGVDVNPEEYGLILIGSQANYALGQGQQPDADEYGKLVNGNLTWGVREMLIMLQKEGGIYYGNTDGRFRLVWPGATPQEDPANTWTTIGEATLTDSWFHWLLEQEPMVGQYPVQQNGANPDFYRLVDPFSHIVGASNPDNYFLYLDCSNRENVLLPLNENVTPLAYQGMRLFATNLGEILTNWQQQPWTPAQIIEAGFNSTFDGTTIRIPAMAVFVGANNQGNLQELEIPDADRAEALVVLPTPEQTAAYKKSNHMIKYVTPQERRAKKVKDLFDGKIIKIKTVENAKSLR